MTSRIPHVFHFVFGLREQTEPFHLMHYLCLASCLHAARPDAIHFHYQNEPYGPLWERIKPYLTLRQVAVDNYASGYDYADGAIAPFRYAHVSDFLRLEILIAEGGIYADMDTLFIRPLPADWLKERCILGHETPPEGAAGSLCNAWIAAEPGAEFCRLWLDQMESAFDGSWSNHSTVLPYRLSRDYPDLVRVESTQAFFHLDHSERGLINLFERAVWLPPETRSLHLWSHLWFDPARRDRLAFAGDLLTPDYVAYARTTYARYARAHLPPEIETSRARLARQRASLWARRLSQPHRIARALARRVLRRGRGAR